MDGYVKILLKNGNYLKDRNNKKEIVIAYENTNDMYHTMWENILEDYNNKDLDDFQEFHFKIAISNQDYMCSCNHLEYSIWSPETEEDLGCVFSRPLDIEHLKNERTFCFDYLVDLLIKDGFDIERLSDNEIEIEISRRQIRFLTDVVEYTNSENFQYHSLIKK